MAIIKNPDGTIGNTISANKFMMDNNLQAKYRLLQSYTNERKGHKLGKKVAGTYGKDYKLSDCEKNLTQFNIDNFISKLQKFEFFHIGSHSRLDTFNKSLCKSLLVFRSLHNAEDYKFSL